MVASSRTFNTVEYAGISFKMKVIALLSLCLTAVAQAGIVSPVFFSHTGNHFVYPVELRKVVSYSPKPLYPGYTAQIYKPDVYGGLQLYTFPVVHQPVPTTAPVFFLPAVPAPPPSTVVAKAKASSSAGIAHSSVVAQSDEPTPFSVVANSGPGAAYSSAVLHPSPSSSFAAGAQASVTGAH